MDEFKTEKIKKVVYKFAELSKIQDKKMCDKLIDKLCSLDINDSIDTILVSLDSLLNRRVLKQEDIFSNVDLILSLNPEKYNTADDLIARLNWIKSMNMEYPKMQLEENHKLLVEAFDKFNQLIQINFDCFYTGGLMAYLATNHELERYHSDLDLFINEEQLVNLKELVDKSENFKFESNMHNKEEHGHEYKITYNETSMSIGLFLFSRLQNNEIVLKQYYYPEHNIKNGLYVDEQYLSKTYSDIMFSPQIREHNGTYYRMQSLESIYNSKKSSRPKDRYDASIIKDKVDLSIDYILDEQRQYNHDIIHKSANDSVVQHIENIMSKSIKDTDISR